jgi:hypothetical protein
MYHEAILRHYTNPPCYHFQFTRTINGEVYSFFWNAVLGIRPAGGFFASEEKESD